MTDQTEDAGTGPEDGAQTRGMSWVLKLAFALLAAAAIAVVLITNSWLTDRFSETTRSRAELRLALYSGNILSELQRNSVVPLLLANDPELIGALESGNFSLTSQRLGFLR